METTLLNPDAKTVVSIDLDGSISSLRRKDGLDLRQFGKVEIQRISDIKLDYKLQRWYIEIIAGPKKGLKFLSSTFKEYEDAVEAEIIYLDALRKQGIF